MAAFRSGDEVSVVDNGGDDSGLEQHRVRADGSGSKHDEFYWDWPNTSPLSTPAGSASIWYLNLDPTPTDISDKSGRGNNPDWVGTGRPGLWSE